MTEITDEVVAAAKRADHEEGIRDGHSYFEVADHQVRRLIAGAVAAERERWHAALADALEGLEDMFAYVPEFFREKWEHQGYIDRARAALTPEGDTQP